MTGLPMTGLWVVLGAVVLALALGGIRRATDGRARVVTGDRRGAVTRDAATLDAATLEAVLGSRATVVQFSTEVCAPCRATRRLLAQVSSEQPGVRHVEIDAAARLDLVRRFDITRTPTLLLVDRVGVVRQRMVGAPRRGDVLAALREVSAD